LTAPSEHTIVISPNKDSDSELFKPISREVERLFGFPTEIATLLEDLEFAHDSNRNQYHSTKILGRLEELAPPTALKVLALTEVDLFIPILTHVYGEAQIGGKACIVSTCRLKENLSPLSADEAYRSRVVKEAMHELGHTFKLRHCQDPACIMHYCRSIRDVDRKSDQMCRYCKVLIGDEIKRLAK
jgi:archaemetzincin